MASTTVGQGNQARSFGRDFLSSVVVFLVALPLCLGIAIASGVPPALGLISGIIGGIIIGSISGAPLQVSGPAAGLVSIVVEIIQTHGLESLGVIVLLAGLMQVTAGLFRLGPLFRAVSPAVVQGMLAGIGLIIFAGQFHVMVDDKPSSNAITNLINIPSAIYKGIVPLDGTSHHLAAAIGLLTLVIIAIWTVVPKKIKLIPAALIAVGASVAVAAWFQMPINYVQIPDQFLDTVRLPGAHSLPLLLDQNIWIAAVTIAFVATAETILSTTALDQMHNGPKAKYDKEIIAQGVGNSIAGVLGALPITGVIVRSTANITAGATSRLSTILHGTWIAGLVLLSPHILEMIPIASLAAVLVYTGYKLIQPKAIKQLLKGGKGEVAIYFITMFAVVATNLLEGVIIGIVLSMFKLLHTMSRLNVTMQTDQESGDIHVFLSGSATFINLPNLASYMEQLPPGKAVHVHIDNLSYIDHACLELITNCEKLYKNNGGHFVIEWHALTEKLNKPQAALAGSIQ